MSRAFVKDDGAEPEPRFDLPDPDSPHYPEASAWALLQGADAGDSRSAERATGYAWGDSRLVEPMRVILADAKGRDDMRVVRLARRFLRAAGAA
jgi:hypothetical protein